MDPMMMMAMMGESGGVFGPEQAGGAIDPMMAAMMLQSAGDPLAAAQQAGPAPGPMDPLSAAMMGYGTQGGQAIQGPEQAAELMQLLMGMQTAMQPPAPMAGPPQPPMM